MQPPGSTRRTQAIRIERGGATTIDDLVAVEEPLGIRIGDRPLAVTMRTPGHDRDLAAGFCLTEGVVACGDDIERIEPCREAPDGNVIDVYLTAEAASSRAMRIEAARRQPFITSSCGLCGKESIDRIRQHCPPLPPGPAVRAETLIALPAQMRDAQATFDATGGLHAAGLFRRDGARLLLREDVGRHNAVDKVIGAAMLSGLTDAAGPTPLHDAVLLVSGRASFEIMQKAAMARIAIVAAVSAPSSLAVEFAREMNMTLVGFLRGTRMNVYHDPNRLS